MTRTIPTRKLSGIPPWPVHHTRAKEEDAMSKPELTLIAGGKSNAPVDVIEKLFEPLLTSMPRKEQIERVCSQTTHLRYVAALASDLVSMNKADFFARVAENPDSWRNELFAEFGYAKRSAKQLAAIVYNAEMRLAVALDLDLPMMGDEGDDDEGDDAA
jgi:hypothetical protein